MAAFFGRLTAMAISSDERRFFVTLGERIACARHATSPRRSLAEVLGVSQQTVHAYEAGSRRIPVSALPVVAGKLGVSLEVLFGEEHAKAARAAKRGPVPQWQRQIEAVAQLPKSQQQFVSRMIEMALAQATAR